MQSLKIKHETGLFEWFESLNLQHITDVVNSLKNGIDTTIINSNPACSTPCIYMINQTMHTHHYTRDEYVSIFERRATRFLELIRNSSELTFVRINPYGWKTSEDEINRFCDSIHSITPKLNIKFLLVNTVDNESSAIRLDASKVQNATLLERYFLHTDCYHDYYLKDIPVIKKQFINYIIETGYTPLESDKLFDDRS